MKIFDTVLISFLTSLSTILLGLFAYWIRNRIKNKIEEKEELKTNKRESLKKLLDAHSDIVTGRHWNEKDWDAKFSDMSKDILLWASDDILIEYGIYMQKRLKDNKIEDHELNFARMILAFRKDIGYKNKHNKISPEQIVLIFKGGYQSPI
jgi:hypothetical protein